MPVERLDGPKALAMLRECLRDGSVKQSWHFKQQLANETIIFTDVEFVLKSGAICDAPEQEIKSGEWKYRVEGPCADRQWIAVIFCFKRIDEALLITVFSVDKFRR